MKPGPKPRLIAERFWEKVNKSSGCWMWCAGTNNHGYGMFWLDGRMQLAHRIAWELHNDQRPPEEIDVLHSCDTPACCNPAHLGLGTHQDNMRDKVERFRSNPGQKNPMSKLSDKDAGRVLSLCREGELTHSKISEQFGISRQQVSKIGARLRWQHLQVTNP